MDEDPATPEEEAAVRPDGLRSSEIEFEGEPTTQSRRRRVGFYLACISSSSERLACCGMTSTP